MGHFDPVQEATDKALQAHTRVTFGENILKEQIEKLELDKSEKE